jgi:hypothetical protein
MITKTRTSTAYAVTLNLFDEYDMMWLKQARDSMRKTNKSLRKIGKTPMRIRLALRDPIRKEAVTNRWTHEKGVRGYDFGGNVVGGIKNARKADVYIYERYA